MANKTTKGKFQPGKSGNPGGRPKELKHVRDLARQYTEEAILALAVNLKHENGAVVNTAADLLLQRGWGKPPATLAGDGGEGEAQLVVKVIRFGDA